MTRTRSRPMASRCRANQFAQRRMSSARCGCELTLGKRRNSFSSETCRARCAWAYWRVQPGRTSHPRIPPRSPPHGQSPWRGAEQAYGQSPMIGAGSMPSSASNKAASAYASSSHRSDKGIARKSSHSPRRLRSRASWRVCRFVLTFEYEPTPERETLGALISELDCLEIKLGIFLLFSLLPSQRECSESSRAEMGDPGFRLHTRIREPAFGLELLLPSAGHLP